MQHSYVKRKPHDHLFQKSGQQFIPVLSKTVMRHFKNDILSWHNGQISFHYLELYKYHHLICNPS